MDIVLREIINITGKIILKTGLHIGAGDTEMHIGGTDNPVVKHPHTNEPYIPGSSIKGKVRSLVELASALVPFSTDSKGLVTPRTLQEIRKENSLPDEKKQNLLRLATGILRVFGSGAGEEGSEEFGPTRAYFSDAFLNRQWLEQAKSNRWSLFEVKSENMINRIQAVAEHPRFTERVPAGAEFDFHITFRVLDEHDEQFFNEILLRGLKLLTFDVLGGSGSRGYGRVEIVFDDINIQERFENIRLWS